MREIVRNVLFVPNQINKNGRAELIRAAIVLCIKELTEYRHQQEVSFRLTSLDLLDVLCLWIVIKRPTFWSSFERELKINLEQSLFAQLGRKGRELTNSTDGFECGSVK